MRHAQRSFCRNFQVCAAPDCLKGDSAAIAKTDTELDDRVGRSGQKQNDTTAACTGPRQRYQPTLADLARYKLQQATDRT